MEIKQITHQDILELQVYGRADATTVPEFEAAILPEAAGQARALIVNLDGVEYISSAGLRSILKLAKACKAGNKVLCFCNLKPEVAEVFRISGFGMILTICDSLAAALVKVQG